MSLPEMSRNRVARGAHGWLPVDVCMLVEVHYYPWPEPCDSVIAATAKVMNLPSMTNDAASNASQLADVYW